MGELKQHQPPMTIDEQEEIYNDKSIIHLPRQDSMTTRNPRNNGANWGIIWRSPGYETTGRLRVRNFKSGSVGVIVKRVYIVCTP